MAGARNGRRSSSSRRRTGPSLLKSSSATTGRRARPKHRSRTHLLLLQRRTSLVSQFDGKKTDSLPSSPERVGSCSTLAPLPLPEPRLGVAATATYWEGSVPQRVSAFDADSDSDLDLIVFPSNPSEEPVLIENVDGKGTFSLSSPRFAFPAGTRKGSVSTLESRDVNDDGISDLIVAYADGGSSASLQGRVHVFSNGSLSTLSGKSSPDVEILLASGVQIKSMSYVEVLDKSNEVAGEEYEDKPRTVRERAILLAVGTDLVRMHTCSSGCCGSASGWAEQTMPALDAGMDVLHVSASQLNVRNDLHMDIALLFDAAGWGAGRGARRHVRPPLRHGLVHPGGPPPHLFEDGKRSISGRGNIGYNSEADLPCFDRRQPDGLTDVVFSGEDGTAATLPSPATLSSPLPTTTSSPLRG